MTNLEKFLERSKQVREAATRTKWWADTPEAGIWDTPHIYTHPGGLVCRLTNYGKMREDAANIVHSCNTAEAKDEMIRVMAKALKSVKFQTVFTQEAHEHIKIAKEALASVEDLAGKVE